MATVQSDLREEFFDLVFGDQHGVLCIATASPGKDDFRQSWWDWPQQAKDTLAFISTATASKKNVWFCINLLSERERKKQFVINTNRIWADLDECDHSIVEPTPNIVIESSPGHFQAIWTLEESLPPDEAEEIARRLTYKYADQGSDTGTWDRTRLLRVPFTLNRKYEGSPTVTLIRSLDVRVPVSSFGALPEPPTGGSNGDMPDMPDPDDIPDAQMVVQKRVARLGAEFWDLYTEVPAPNDDWSARLWKLVNICLEAGLTPKEALAVCAAAGCNKYKRDGRSMDYLWRDIHKARIKQTRIMSIIGETAAFDMPELIAPSALKGLPDTFIENYRQWAVERTDATPAYHELTAFMVLSATLAANIHLNTSYGRVVPNLWGLILGDSTLTRKTTAFRMGLEMIAALDREILLATDGSVEGILTALSLRPNRVSLFYKDEFSGFIGQMHKRDYMAGMQEVLTNLYDVPPFYTRRLRKEVINVVSPVFILFGGGIKDKLYSSLTDEHVLSGFLPRFLVVAGEANLKTIRSTGPPQQSSADAQNSLSAHLAGLHNAYVATHKVKILGEESEQSSNAECFLTGEAWTIYQEIETKMVEAAADTTLSMLALPFMERMSRSLLKMSCLIAASRQEPDSGTCTVEATDILVAAKYVQQWGIHSIDLLQNVGRGSNERSLQKILAQIQRHPGIYRSKVMRDHHLTKRETDEIVATLIDRQHVRITKEEGAQRLWGA